MSQPDLGALLADAKAARGWSFEAMSRACGGVPTGKRLFQLINSPLKNFPDPDTIRGLQKATGASATELVMAAARSLGLDVTEADPDALHVPGISGASDTARQALLEIGWEISALSAQAAATPSAAAPSRATREPTERKRPPRGASRRHSTELPENWQDLAAYRGPEEHLRRADEWDARGEESQG
ncbi:hypothetical protein [Sinomonas terrae]|uniref:HTH cro/C1-type domain-containing protein n=1 Tax=Sinomonas terrae TaxID=2908838 RepID=A0ABS9U330_9MICC|nr:hypothetical protein [Sinomonas terrae]MCH6470981.1 hypothetical protein [Sinomonas terrae]